MSMNRVGSEKTALEALKAHNNLKKMKTYRPLSVR